MSSRSPIRVARRSPQQVVAPGLRSTLGRGPYRLIALLGCATLSLAPLANAEKSDREKPIFYQGDTGGANLGTKDGELSGNVVITQGTLTIHADRGTSMASKTVALLLADLGVTKSHSRPHCSNDNPYSEAQFKTLKYRPEFPDRFGSIEDGRAFCRGFFSWYNHDHRHSGVGFHTPAAVHFGRAESLQLVRARVLQAAYAAHPERFVHNPPVPPQLPGIAWINKPTEVVPAP